MSDSVEHSQPTVCGVWIERHAVLVYAKRMLQSLASESPWYRAESGELDGRGQGSQSLELVHRACVSVRVHRGVGPLRMCFLVCAFVCVLEGACVLSCAFVCPFRVLFALVSCLGLRFEWEKVKALCPEVEICIIEKIKGKISIDVCELANFLSVWVDRTPRHCRWLVATIIRMTSRLAPHQAGSMAGSGQIKGGEARCPRAH